MVYRLSPLRYRLCLCSCLCIAALIIGLCLPARAEDYVGRFDRMDRRINNGNGYCGSLDNTGDLAWGESYVLMAYMEMYRATHDMAYLDKLVDQFERVLACRDDVRHVKDYYRNAPMAGWGADEYSRGRWPVWAVHTGMICAGPAEFVQVVRGEKRLRSRYGKIADRFLAGIKEAVGAQASYWRDGPNPGEGHYVDPAIGPLPLNQQNALGRVELTLYLITRDHTYRDRVEKLAAFFKRRLRRTADGAYDWSYWPKLDGSGADSEDISHAAINIDFAVRCRWAHIGFNSQDMLAFGRTWTRHVRRASGEFADTVGGGGGPNTHIPQALGRWLDLCPFERSIFADAQRTFASVDEEKANGANLLGIAKLARWDKELHRKKRRLFGKF